MVHVNAGTDRLIGRDRELAKLRSFLGEAVTDGGTLLLTGEPGVGKTALLVAAVEMATADGVRVIRGGGVEYETDVSFAGLHQLVDPLSDDLRGLPRSSRAVLEVALGIGSGPAPERLAVLSAWLALFRRAASTAPLLIVIDDLHWLDRASGAVVGFVGRRLRGSRIGLLGAMRPGFGGFFERAGLSEFDIAPLLEADAMELLARQFVHLPTRVLRGVVDEAQGNPLALLEFAALAGRSHDSGRPQMTVPSGFGREVRTLYQAKIEHLPEPTRRMLLLAALDGSGDLGVLAAASGSEGLAELGPAERDHLIVLDDRIGGMRFRHPMIKSVVVEHSTHDERRAAHDRLAALFADQPERRGHHLAEAAVAPDEDIAAAVEDGAHRTLERGDVVGAISRLLRAADPSPNRKDRSRRLADAAYVGADSAGQLDSSSELLRDAHRRDPTLGETLHAAVATAYLLLNSDGNAETAHRLLTVAIESSLGEPDQDRDGLSEGLYTLVLVCHYAGRPGYWAPFHNAMDRLAATAPAEVRLLAETFADPVSASECALSELEDEIQRLGNTEDDALIIRTAIAAFYADRLRGCQEPLSRVVRDGREGGAVTSAMRALLMIAFDELNAGRWLQGMQSGHRNAYECIAAFSATDFRGDLAKLSIPSIWLSKSAISKANGLAHLNGAPRSPGTVSSRVHPVACAAAPECPVVRLDGGAWCWFNEPRAVAVGDLTVSGWVARNGDIRVASYDNESGEVVVRTLHAQLQRDDHANPSFYVRRDGRITAFYSRHAGRPLYHRTTTEPGQVGEWGPERTVGTNRPGPYGYTYPNPVWSPLESKLYLFWRGGNFLPNFSTSADEGESWAPARTLMDDNEPESHQRPYVKYAARNGVIHLAYNQAHPLKRPTSVFYMKYTPGTGWQRAGGARLGEPPFIPTDGDRVFNAWEHGQRSWIHDIAVAPNGRPRIVFASFSRASDYTDHRYWYARWDGRRWRARQIVRAGPSIDPDGSIMYSAGIVLDQENPGIVYLARKKGNRFQIEVWRTSDGGANWHVTPITSGARNHMRPVVPRNRPGRRQVQLLYMYGRYNSYRTYQTAIALTNRAIV